MTHYYVLPDWSDTCRVLKRYTEYVQLNDPETILSWKDHQVGIDSVSCMKEGPSLPTYYDEFPMQLPILNEK